MMIKKLRIRLVAAAMLSLLIVLLVIMALLNLKNYQSVITRADNILIMLRDRNAVLPSRHDDSLREQIVRNYRFQQFPNEIRYYHITLSTTGDIMSVNTRQIDETDTIDVELYIQSAARMQQDKGFVQQYRFIRYEQEKDIHYIFLDCTASLTVVQMFLRNSIVISAVGLMAILLLITFFSGRIIKPVAQSYEYQKQFITDAGHEMKTPITIIDADAELVEMELPDNEWVKDIRIQTKRMAALTRDLIYLSRMEEQYTMTMIEFPLSEAVSECAASFQALAKTQHKTFTAHIEPMITFYGDENSLLKLVSILLDNAVKYTEESGQISLLLDKQGRKVRLRVENTTDCLDPQTLTHLFDRFYRADAARDRTKGFGLGLSIAQTIAAKHKGKITVSMSENKSFVITVLLPE